MGATAVIARADFDRLLEALTGRGYTVIGPTVSEGAIVLEEIGTATDLPVGWTDEQEAGRYRLTRRDDEALFGYSLGPQSWKREQLPAQITLWRSAPDGDGGLSTFEDAPRIATARVPRRPLLRAARDGHPRQRARVGPRAGSPRARSVRHRRPMRAGRRDVLLRLDGHGAGGQRRLRPRAHRAARRRSPSLPRRGRLRPRRRGARRRAASAGRGRRADAGRDHLRAYGGDDGARARHRRDQGAALPQPPSTRAGTRSPSAA